MASPPLRDDRTTLGPCTVVVHSPVVRGVTATHNIPGGFVVRDYGDVSPFYTIPLDELIIHTQVEEEWSVHSVFPRYTRNIEISGHRRLL